MIPGYKQASMWPHFFKCGSSGVLNESKLRTLASMWPHFFKCGSPAITRQRRLVIASFNVAALFQVRKCTYLRKRASDTLPLLQCGRTFSSAEVTSMLTLLEDTLTLQCGRTFSSAEVIGCRCFWWGQLYASMWPHFFKCGSCRYVVVGYGRNPASMWPHFFKCGSRKCPAMCARFFM